MSQKKRKSLQDLVGAEFTKVDESAVCGWVASMLNLAPYDNWYELSVLADTSNVHTPWMLSDVLLLPWKIPITRYLFHPGKQLPDIMGDLAYEQGSVFMVQDSDLSSADSLWLVTTDAENDEDNTPGYLASWGTPRMLSNTLTVGKKRISYTAAHAKSVLFPSST